MLRNVITRTLSRKNQSYYTFSRSQSNSPTALTGSPSRTYLYIVDVHGQLFLDGTVIKNFTSCYKEPMFLDFFNMRIKRNDGSTEEDVKLRTLGYEFVSPCGIERNYIKSEASVLVFQSLTSKGEFFSSLSIESKLTCQSFTGLSYAGYSTIPFDPSNLRVDPESGYLYHPSPLPNQRRQRSGQLISQFGPYSLLRSSLVLDNFADSLEMENDESGSFEWEGKRWKIGKLADGMVYKSLVR